MFRWLLILVVLLASVAGLVLGVLNADAVSFDLIIREVRMPLGALVLSALAVGLVLGLILAWLLFWIPARLTRDKPSDSDKGNALADRQNA